MFNPKVPVQVSPKEYEQQVVRWLTSASHSEVVFEIEHLKNLEGAGGEYELDAIATLSIFGGSAEIKIIIECKRYAKPVEREMVMVLWSKLQALKAHKGIIFSTSGFQSGAIQYATDMGIACITFVDERSLIMTKSLSSPESDYIRPSAGYAGVLLQAKGDGLTHAYTIDRSHSKPLADWLAT